MGQDVERRDREYVPGRVRRMGSACGLAVIGFLDLLALDDITTAGAWMPEIGIVIASIPALIVLGWFTFRPAPPEGYRGGEARE